VVIAPFGMTLGGGAEITLHAPARQPFAELYIGLVEVGSVCSRVEAAARKCCCVPWIVHLR